MANCVVCEQHAKWRSMHPDCRTQATAQAAGYFLTGDGSLPVSAVPKGTRTMTDVWVEGALTALRQWAADGATLTAGRAVQSRLTATPVVAKTLGWKGALRALDMALQLAAIRAGQRVTGPSGFNVTSSESVAYVTAPSVTYLEDTMRRHYRGKSRGVSVPVLPGLYLRAGRTKGRAVDTQQRVVVSRRGTAAFTTEHFYYRSPQKAFRVAWDHMITVDYYANGFGFQRDAQGALPQTFTLAYPWFYHALIEELRHPGTRVRLVVPEFGKVPKAERPAVVENTFSS